MVPSRASQPFPVFASTVESRVVKFPAADMGLSVWLAVPARDSAASPISAGAVLSLYSARMVTVDSGKEFSGEARGAVDDVDYISAVSTPFTPTCDGHPSPGADRRASGRWSSDRQERLAPVASLLQLTVGDLPTPPLGGA